MRSQVLMAGFVFAVAGFAWTSAGQSSDPLLDAAELPLEVWRDCHAPHVCVGGLDSRWVGRSRTGGGDLFLVHFSGCPLSQDGCRIYLIERQARITRLLLTLDGPFGVRLTGGRYPVFEVRRALDEIRSSIYRYEWRDGRYVRSAAQVVYRIGGEECGTRERCRAAAERALREGQIDRALQIWQQVDGLSWI